MAHIDQLDSMLALDDSAFSENGDADKIVEEIKLGLDADLKIVSDRTAAARKFAAKHQKLVDQIAAHQVQESKLQTDLNAAREDGERTAQSIRNLREAFSEKGETATEEELQTFNEDITRQLDLKTRNETLQETLQNDLDATTTAISALQNEASQLADSIAADKTTQSAEIWNLLDVSAVLAAALSSKTSWLLGTLLPQEKDASDYLIERETGLPVGHQALISKLRGDEASPNSGPADDRGVLLRLNKAELESRVQQLLNHMTSLRISEEKDTDTYVQRLKLAYLRVEKEAERQHNDLIEGQLASTQVGHARLEKLKILAAHLHNEILRKLPNPEEPQPQKVSETAEAIQNKIEEAAKFTSGATDFANRLVVFLDRSRQNLRNLEEQFCTQPMIDGAISQSISVSRAAEVQHFYRVLPLFWAVIITILVKIIIARNTSLAVHENASMILIMSFVITWILSVSIGRNNRTRRMQELQNATHEDFETLTQCNEHKQKKRSKLKFWHLDSWLTNPSSEGKTVRFTPEAFDQILSNTIRDEAVTPFNARRSLRKEKRSVPLRNCWALLIPIGLLALVELLLPESDNRTYLSTLENGQVCTLMEGRLTAADETTYYLRVKEDNAGQDEDPAVEIGVANFIFPELISKTIPRDAVISIVDDPKKAPAQRCADGVIVPDYNGFSDPNKVFPASFRAQISQGQSLLNKVIVDGNVNASIQNELGALLEDLKGQLGDRVTDEQVLRFIMTSDLQPTSVPGPGVNNGDVIQNFYPQINGAKEVATAIEKLTVSFQADPQTNLAMEQLRLDGLREFAKLAGAAAQSKADLVKMVEDNTKLIAQMVQDRPASNTVIPVINEGHTTTIKTPSFPSALVVAPSISVAQESQPTSIVTYLSLNGSSNVQQSIQNTLFMPFFPDPVDKTPMEEPLDAFDYGLKNTGFKPPKDLSSKEADTDYFSVFADALQKCLLAETDLKIVLDVQGHASSSWKAKLPADQTKEEYNHYLAEGRRMGALLRLKSKMADTNGLMDKIKIVGMGIGQVDALSTFGEIEESGLIRKQKLRAAYDRRRFELPGDLTKAQKVWLSAVPFSDTNAKNAFEEMFARTVIIEIKGFDGTSCAFQ